MTRTSPLPFSEVRRIKLRTPGRVDWAQGPDRRGVGTFEIAKSFDAEVTGVCGTRNVEMVRSLGADHVIDYTQEDFTQSGHKYDLIFQLAGTRSPSECRRALTPNGTLVLSSGESGGHEVRKHPFKRAGACAATPVLSLALFT